MIVPNPSPGKFTIFIKNGQNVAEKIEITDLLGKEVYSTNEPVLNSKEIDISSNLPGIYFIKVNAGEKMFTEKIIIQ